MNNLILQSKILFKCPYHLKSMQKERKKKIQDMKIKGGFMILKKHKKHYNLIHFRIYVGINHILQNLQDGIIT